MLNRYNITYNINKTLFPKVFSIVKALPGNYLYFESYDKLKHPGSILNRATDEIVRSFNKLLLLYQNLFLVERKNGKVSDKNKLREFLDELQILIGHFDSFQDECYLILKSLCLPPEFDKAPDEKFVHEWLKRNGFSCSSDFIGYTKNIQKYIDLFSNGLKHGNQRFDFISAESEGYRIDGIFIEELKGKEVKGVYPWLPRIMEQATVAFSINYILKVLLICFYEISDGLEKSIRYHINKTHNDANLKFNIVKYNDNYKKMVLGLADLPNLYYPYEYKKQPKISRKGDELKISYPHGDRMPYSPKLKVTLMFVADGYTNKFSLPSLG